VAQETGDHDEATVCARTPWRVWACGADSPRLERARPLGLLPALASQGRKGVNSGSPKVPMSQVILASFAKTAVSKVIRIKYTVEGQPEQKTYSLYLAYASGEE
jgi:hypothetical protein